jgi:hypothetical protein
MSAFTPYMRLFGTKIADAGYSIVPIAAGQKFPGEYANGKWFPMKGWEALAYTKTPELLIENVWAQMPGAGIGICCGGQSKVIGVDIDVMDAEISGAIRRKIEEMLGETPLVRVGQAPKVLLVYRTTEPMQKLSYQPIEVLGQGQQFVSHGIHPKTGQPYQWPLESPAETPVESLPLVTPEQVKAAVEAAYALVPEEMRPARLTGSSDAPHVSSKDTSPATPEAIRQALQHIPNPDLPWDAWKRVLMATFAASHGSEGAYFDFLEWSRKSTKHNDTITRKEWTSCRASPPRSIGFGTLHHLAREHGWQPPADLPFNEAKDTSDVDLTELEKMPIENQPPAIPAMPKTERLTVQDKLAAATPDERRVLLGSVGLGESNGIILPVADTGGLGSQEFIARQLATPHEETTHLFRFDEPERLQLTQEEIEHGTLPAEFIAQFPQEWLYTSSLVGQMAAWIDASCQIPHRVFALMAAFTAWGALVGRQYRTASGLRPNLATVIIAGTGSGKEGPRSAVTRLFLAADAGKYIGPRGGFSSGSGVVQGLVDQPNMWLAVDEFGKKIAAYGMGKIDQNQREMIALFLESLVNDYVGGKGYANSKENPTKNIVLPNLNIFGSSQIEEITNALSSAAAADGLIQRFLFVPTFAEYVPMRRDYTRPEVPQSLVDSIKWMMGYLDTLGGDFAMNADATTQPSQIEVAMTSQAQELFYGLDERRVEMARAGRVMWVRSAAMAVKVAMLEAIARDPVTPVVDAELLDSARRLVDWFTQYSETYVSSKVADNDTQREVNRIRSLISDAGANGLTGTELTRKTQSMRKRDRDDHVRTLIESGQVIERPLANGGRPGKVFVLSTLAATSNAVAVSP